MVMVDALQFRQRGAASLLISLVLLAVITLVSLNTSRTVLVEQKVAANVYRSNMAFEAAEAGMELALAYIGGGRDRDSDGILPADVSTPDADEFLFDADNDGTNDSNTFTLANGASVTVTLEDLSTSDTVATEIVSTGLSDDNMATRTITQVVALVNPLPNVPENPLLTRGTAIISGSADVYNAEGHSTIWSGGAVDLGSSATINTFIANPADAGYPNCLGDASTPCVTVGSSDSGIAGLDVIEQDSSLANLTEDEFFENFFGMPPTEYRNSMVTMDLDPATDDVSAEVHLSTNPEVIWVDGDVTLSAGTIVGCGIDPPGNDHCTGAQISPVIMIVNGTLTMQGNADFYGMLYVMGGTSGHGNPYSVGSIVVAGEPSNLTGSFEIHYNSDVLRRTSEGGRPASSGGSWRDFN
ncbi:MAG: PilX N-terminal domain-containing pilus assembly protein [Gammaproteobacteria bacterium]|nr:PilX N-terminal domain-containing pilus assembly protein [Gammaproteobacteria bacterium]